MKIYLQKFYYLSLFISKHLIFQAKALFLIQYLMTTRGVEKTCLQDNI